MAGFGELLRRLRGERSQREVSAELGMPVTTLSSLENQEGVPRGPVLQKLAEYFAVPPAYFYPASPTRMKSSDSAREWLTLVRKSTTAKQTVATHAPPDFPEEVKKRLAEKIQQKKNANAAHIQPNIRPHNS